MRKIWMRETRRDLKYSRDWWQERWQEADWKVEELEDKIERLESDIRIYQDVVAELERKKNG